MASSGRADDAGRSHAAAPDGAAPADARGAPAGARDARHRTRARRAPAPSSLAVQGMHPGARSFPNPSSGRAAAGSTPRQRRPSMLEGVKDVGMALDGAVSRWFGRAVDLIVKLLLPLAI